MAEGFHIDERGGGGQLGLVAQIELVQRARKLVDRAGFPPGVRRGILNALNPRAAAQLHLLPIDERAKAGHFAVQDDRAVDLSIAGRAEKHLLLRIGIQNARHFAAAVQTQVECVQRPHAAAVQHLGAFGPQIRLAAGD